VSGVRCFVGVKLSSEFADACHRARELIQREDAAWRDQKWVPDENLHVTLRFIGTVRDEDIDDVRAAVGATLKPTRAFDLAFDGLRAFPALRKCRMLWVAYLDPDEQCAGLARQLETAVPRTDGRQDHRRFRAHATIVRARRPGKVSQAALVMANHEFDSTPRIMSVGEATLFSSELEGPSPVYRAIGTWRLAGA
jgi:2'-5' RNA ligase